MLSRERGESIRQIAKKLGRAPSTISRELRRNPGTYRAVSAQKNYRQRRKACVRRKVLHDVELHNWTSNNDGTHSRTCYANDDTQTADCSDSNNADELCDTCGYDMHEHSYGEWTSSQGR